MDKYKYSFVRTQNYCYRDSDVLVNKLGILEEEILMNYERDLVAIRQMEINRNPIRANLDFSHLKKIHFHLF